MNDLELDTLLAGAREETPADAGAAERFLAWHREAQLEESSSHSPLLAGPQTTQTARAAWWPALLACAAMLTGALVLRPAPALPPSAAYAAYQGALGEGW